MPAHRDAFGAGVVEGVIGGGAWGPKQPPGIKAFYDKLLPRRGGKAMDPWGDPFCYGASQLFQKAIERAGILDQKAIRDVIATLKLNTILRSYLVG